MGSCRDSDRKLPYTFEIDETVRRKVTLIERCLPFKSVIDFGGMWEVDGYYSKLCLEKFGAKKVTMIDFEASENWRRDESLRRGIDFRLGDFADERFMDSVGGRHDLALAYDVLLHQIDLRHTLSLMLSKTKRFFLIYNPVLPDESMKYRNTAILLLGSKEGKLIPFHEKWTKEIDYWQNFSDPSNISPNGWIWALTPSFVESLMAGLGWRLEHKEVGPGWSGLSKRWRYGGFIFKRR